jgi:hypothetical protein
MRAAKNTIHASDVTTLPIKVKYSSSYSEDTIGQYGIRVYTGINEPISPELGYSEEAMTYRSVKHLYYTNYISGSFPTTSSQYDNWLQSTAASGTIECDVRFFPTGAYDTVQVLSIPRSVYGENIARRSFSIMGDDYHIVDDGNGNIRDLINIPDYVIDLYYTDIGMYYELIQLYGTPVGNIFYSQGIIVVTNPDFQGIFGDYEFLLQENGYYVLNENESKIIVDVTYLLQENGYRLLNEDDSDIVVELFSDFEYLLQENGYSLEDEDEGRLSLDITYLLQEDGNYVLNEDQTIILA